MTKIEALHKFFSSFGVKAFQSSLVPSGEKSPDFPYITYDNVSAGFGAEAQITAQFWTQDTTGEEIQDMETAFFERLVQGGEILTHDKGSIWLKAGEPFTQVMRDDGNSSINRLYINITAEFFTI